MGPHFPIPYSGPIHVGLGPAEIIQVVIALLTLIIAIATAIAARAAVESATGAADSVLATERSSAATLFSNLMAQYSAPEMLHSLRVLENWHRTRTPNFAGGNPPSSALSLFHANVIQWARRVESTDSSDQAALDLTVQRRRVSYFYWLVACLIKGNYLPDTLSNTLRDLSGKDIYAAVVVPMELALREEIRSTAINRGDVPDPDDGGMRQLLLIQEVFFRGQGLPEWPPPGGAVEIKRST